MSPKEIQNLVNRATVNNVNGYDVIEALRLASPLFSKNLITKLNRILKTTSKQSRPNLFKEKP